MKKLIIFLSAAALCACAKNSDLSSGEAKGDDIRLTVTAETRAGFTGNGYTDTIQFVIDQKADAAYNYNKALAYRSASKTWESTDNSDTKWVTSGTHDFTAYIVAPAVSNASLTGDFNFTVPADQSTDASSVAADLMTATQSSVSSDGDIVFTLKHRMARLQIVVTGAPTMTDLTVGGLKTSANVNLAAGTVTAVDDYAEIKAHKESDGVYEVLLPAQTIDKMYLFYYNSTDSIAQGVVAIKAVTLAEGDYRRITVDASKCVNTFVGLSTTYNSLSSTEILSYKAAVFNNNTTSSLGVTNGSLETIICPKWTNNVDFSAQKSSIKTLILPKCQNLSPQSFSNFSALSTVYLPKVTFIPSYAFNLCPNLKSFDFSNVSEIQAYAFRGTGFTGVLTLPKCVKLGDRVFYQSAITEAQLPLVTEMSGAFTECPNLVTVNAPNAYVLKGGTSLQLFNGDAALKNVTLAWGKITSIPQFLFEKCTAEFGELTLSSLTSVGNNAFYGTKVTKVHMPKITSLGELAFMNCTQLTEVDAPLVTSCSDKVFYLCSALTSINFDLSAFTSLPSCMFASCGNLVLGEVRLKNCTTVGSQALNKPQITKVIMPKVTSLGGWWIAGSKPTYIEAATGVTTDVTLDADAFTGFTNGANCDLVVGPGVTGVSGNTWGGVTWKSITVSSTPSI